MAWCATRVEGFAFQSKIGLRITNSSKKQAHQSRNIEQKDYLCRVKIRALHIVSVMMAIQILFISTGWTVNFHYCTEDHQLVSSFGNASQFCDHCRDHPHQHMSDTEYHHHLETLHFDSKCCCEDFDSRIQFADDYVFSPEKSFPVFLNAVIVPHLHTRLLVATTQCVSRIRTLWKIPIPSSGRQITILFSNLRLEPSIF